MNSMALFLTVSKAFHGFAAVFLACELGQRVSSAFERTSLRIEQFDWHLFASESKRILPIIMVVAQEPVTLECFGSI